MRPTKRTSTQLTFALMMFGSLAACAPDAALDEKLELSESESELFVLSTNVWQSRTIPVCWETAGFATEKGWIQDAIARSWQASSSVRFTGWGTCAAGATGLRVRLQNSGGFTVGLGTALNGVANGVNLNLWGTAASPTNCASTFTREDCVRSTAVHEFGHALGFAHEQNRPDTPASCTQAPQGTNGNVTNGAWDIASVMNYCNPVRNGRGAVSTLDIDGVARFYGDPRARGGDIVAFGASGWTTIPVAFSGDDGGFSYTNETVGAFGGWATTGGVSRLVADFSGDGRTDVLLTGVGGWTTMPLARAAGNGSWIVTNSSVTNFPAWAATAGVKVLTGDFNGDGRADVALTGGAGWSTMPVAFSNGNGTFNVTNSGVANFPTWATVAGARALVGDFNGDGRADIALTGGAGWSTVPVAFSNGNGTFNVTNASVTGIPDWVRAAGAQALVGDFNADGRADIALSGGTGWSTIPLARSNGDGTFAVTNSAAGSFPAWATTAGARIHVGDFTGDGRADLALSGPGAWNTVPVAASLGNGNYTVTNAGVGAFGGWASLANVKHVVGDFNGDGRADLALTGAAGWNTVPVAFATGGGSFAVTNEVVSHFPGVTTAAGITVASGRL